MKLTKADKEMLAERYRDVWGDDENMVSHCVKRASGYIEFGDDIFVMGKPHIETEFWFGEHTWDYDDVCKRCDDASRDIDYFVDYNIDNCDAHWYIDAIDNGTRVPYLARSYSGSDTSRFVWIDWKHPWETTGNELRRLNSDEVADLRDFCKAEIEKFERRLTSYLKRYGLSKCRYNVYWADR